MTNLLSGNKKSGTATALLLDRGVWLVFIFLGMLFSKQCIDPFNPEIDDTDELLVIDGSLIKGAEEQIVSISFSAPLNMRAFNPVSGCNVKVIDEAGAEIVFREKSWHLFHVATGAVGKPQMLDRLFPETQGDYSY